MNQCERIVHFDLKGAPLKIPYLEQVILMAKSWGATGFLFEWEDTFPYSDEIADIGSVTNSGGDGMYSMAEVQHIFQFVRDNGLISIQLVQTIGHLEFVLKHPTFSGLRELPSSPSALCPSRAGAMDLIKKMVDQALDAQPDAKYFHIGADEVWHKGLCPQCKTIAANSRWHSDALFLEHIQNLTQYIKKKRPGLNILMWDDMLRHIHTDAFHEYDLSDIHLVYWNYHTMLHFRTDHILWDKYSRYFPKVWAGSAYKGANGSNQVLSPVSRYVSTHEAWLREYNICKDKVQFLGIILTGWSRYAHYATLCELLPPSLPSLHSCLRLVTMADSVPKDHLVTEYLSSHEWPGEELSRCLHSFVVLRERCNNLLNDEKVGTWLTPWQVERGYTASEHVQAIEQPASILQKELKTLYDQIALHLSNITGKRSTEEWLTTNIVPVLTKITELYNNAHSAVNRDVGVRPLGY